MRAFIRDFYNTLCECRPVIDIGLHVTAAIYAILIIIVGNAQGAALPLSTTVLYPIGTTLGGYVIGYVARAILRHISQSGMAGVLKDLVMALPLLLLFQMLVSMVLSTILFATESWEMNSNTVVNAASQIFVNIGLILFTIESAASYFDNKTAGSRNGD